MVSSGDGSGDGSADTTTREHYPGDFVSIADTHLSACISLAAYLAVYLPICLQIQIIIADLLVSK